MKKRMVLRSACSRLGEDIKARARRIRRDVCNREFRPSDLELDAGRYGCFSDHSKGTTSSKHCKCKCAILKLSRVEITPNNWKIFYYKFDKKRYEKLKKESMSG